MAGLYRDRMSSTPSGGGAGASSTRSSPSMATWTLISCCLKGLEPSIGTGENRGVGVERAAMSALGEICVRTVRSGPRLGFQRRRGRSQCRRGHHRPTTVRIVGDRPQERSREAVGGIRFRRGRGRCGRCGRSCPGPFSRGRARVELGRGRLGPWHARPCPPFAAARERHDEIGPAVLQHGLVS
jgi:hypothetical protein